MSNRSISILTLACKPKPDVSARTDFFPEPRRYFVEIKLSHSAHTKAYVLTAWKMTLEKCHRGDGQPDYDCKGISLGTHKTVLVERAARFSAKTLAKLAQTAHLHPEIPAIRDYVLAANKLELAEPNGVGA